MSRDWADPKALIAEAYRIEGLAEPECRSIFLDWALSLGDATDQKAALRALVDRHVAEFPAHPMSLVLREGLAEGVKPARRGGWRGRRRGSPLS
jgi:hypothetical protein